MAGLKSERRAAEARELRLVLRAAVPVKILAALVVLAEVRVPPLLVARGRFQHQEAVVAGVV